MHFKTEIPSIIKFADYTLFYVGKTGKWQELLMANNHILNVTKWPFLSQIISHQHKKITTEDTVNKCIYNNYNAFFNPITCHKNWSEESAVH